MNVDVRFCSDYLAGTVLSSYGRAIRTMTVTTLLEGEPLRSGLILSARKMALRYALFFTMDTFANILFEIADKVLLERDESFPITVIQKLQLDVLRRGRSKGTARPNSE